MPSWLDALIDAVLPPKKDVALARTLTPAYIKGAMRIRLAKEPWLLALFEYQDPGIRALVRAVKFSGETRALPILAESASEILTDMIADKVNMAGWSTPLLVPMPASKKRIRERGYNQAERIAEAFLPYIKESVQYAPRALARHDRKSQVEVERAERGKNIRNAFYVPRPEFVSGKQVILIDDVVETASTMKDARRALFAAGVSDVLGIALSH